MIYLQKYSNYKNNWYALDSVVIAETEEQLQILMPASNEANES